MRKTNKSTLFDIYQATFTSLVILGVTLYVLRLLVQGLGPESFGAYALARRIVATIIPFSTLGLTIGLARYVSLKSNSPIEQHAYIITGIGLISGFTLLIVGVILAADSFFTNLLFDNPQLLTLLHATVLLVFAYSLNAILLTIYRGYQQIQRVNLLQIINMAGWPLIVVLIMADRYNASHIIFAMALMPLLTSLILTRFIVTAFKNLSNKRSRIRHCVKELFRYGLPRVPGDIALASMFTVGPIVVYRVGLLADAGYFYVSQSLLRLTEVGVVAIGLALLPKIAEFHGKGKTEAIIRHVKYVGGFAFHVGIFASVQLFIFSDVIIMFWFGEEYTPAIPIMRIIILGVGPYLIYATFRSVIDAISIKAVNTLNLLISLLLTIGFTLGLIGYGSIGPAIGLTVGVTALGFLSFLYVHRKYQLPVTYLHPIAIGVYNILLGFIGMGLREIVPIVVHPIIQMILIVGLLTVVYLWVLKKLEVEWLGFLVERICNARRKRGAF